MQQLTKDYGWETTDEDVSHGYILPAVKALIGAQTQLKVLDAGCGNGFMAAQLAALGHDVIGVDASPDGVELAREEFTCARFECASVYEPMNDFTPEGGFDLIVSTEVIEHLFSPQEFLDNMFAHLRPGGSIILSTPYHGYLKNLALSLFNAWDHHHTVDWEGGHIKFFSERTLEEMLTKAGFGTAKFHNAGRLPLLWKSMVCRADKPENISALTER